ncbi:unnamed protein product, partial [Sphenostylis stenocarpa]
MEWRVGEFQILESNVVGCRTLCVEAIARLGTLWRERENEVDIGSNYAIHHTSRVIATQIFNGDKECAQPTFLKSKLPTEIQTNVGIPVPIFSTKVVDLTCLRRNNERQTKPNDVQGDLGLVPEAGEKKRDDRSDER